MDQQKHEMVLVTTHPSGAEEWNCYECGRRLLIRWEPEFTKVVLEAGDDQSIHGGGKGGLRIGRMQATPMQDPDGGPGTGEEDIRLVPWKSWMEESDFEQLWKDEDE